MATAAIRLAWIVEQPIAAQLVECQPRLALQPIVELAAVRMKARLLDLVPCHGEQRLGHRQPGRGEHRIPSGSCPCGIRPPPQFCCDGSD